MHDVAGNLPFRVDYTCREGVYDQLLGALKTAIGSGVYKAGDVLPSMKEVAAGTGVSFCTVRRAFKALTLDGFICPRPRKGSVVLDSASSRWNGNILFVYPEEDEASFYVQVFAGALRKNLLKSGYLFTQVPTARIPDDACTELSRVLLRPFALAIVMYELPSALKLLKKSGVRILRLHGAMAGDTPNICVSSLTAIKTLVDHCVKSNVRSVVEVGYNAPGGPMIANYFREAGIKASRFIMRVPRAFLADELETLAARAFLRRGTDKLPDLFFFNDDFVAQGGLMALLAMGVRIPEDVRVVTLSNKGIGPAFVKSLARIEHDPARYGEIVARYVIAALSPRRHPRLPTLTTTYIPGETFPEV